MLTELKQQEEYAFLKEVDSIALQQSLRHLDSAFNNFFKKQSKYPRFKSKHNHHQSYRTINQGNNVRIENKKIKLPKLGWVNIVLTMDIGKIHSVTIKRTPTNKYFVSLTVEYEPIQHSNEGCVTEIDMGIKEFYSDNHGNVVHNPKYLERSMKILKREQRKLSRKQKVSNNRNKQRMKVARIHEKVVSQRKDFLHKESLKLVKENQIICIEDLQVKNMIRNHKLAQAIGSVSWSEFFRMLEYKGKWYGTTIVRVPTFYPSSQECHVCGYKNIQVKNLSVRKWECPKCHTYHDRDMNAGMNILNKGLSMLEMA